jgi:antitoxin (DNA-binding transcriptional repressor) of toxin-antitoxin stability system
MATVTVEEAQAKLPELIEGLKPGETLVINRNGHPWAQLEKKANTSPPCKAGVYRKAEFSMSPEFDAPLEDFKDYME